MHLNAWFDVVAWTQISCYHAPVINTFLIHFTRCVSMCLTHLLGHTYRRIVPGWPARPTPKGFVCHLNLRSTNRTCLLRCQALLGANRNSARLGNACASTGS